MRGLSWWIEWPRGALRVGVVLLVAAATVAAAWEYPTAVGDLGRTASEHSTLSYSDREVAGGNEVVEDQRAVYEARSRIPEDATYHVAVGEEYEGDSSLTVPYVASFYHSFLVPRRGAERAPWVICYGCDLAEYGPEAEVVWSNEEGISIVRWPG